MMNGVIAIAMFAVYPIGCTTSKVEKATSDEDPAELIELLALSVGPAKDADRTYNAQKEGIAYDAAEKLRRQGEQSFRLLLKHLDDNRFSISFEAVAYHTVGNACYEIIRQQIFAVPDDYRYDAYWREGSDGKSYRNPYFYETNDLKPSLFDESTLREWLRERHGKSLHDLQIEALSWLIRKEKTIGFRNEDDKKHYLYPLQRQLQKIQMGNQDTKKKTCQPPDIGSKTCHPPNLGTIVNKGSMQCARRM